MLTAGVLAELGEPGMFALGTRFTAVFEALDALYVRTFADLDAEVWRFPPVEPKSVFEKTDYVASFPQLTGSLSVFTGGTAEHAELLKTRSSGDDWEGHLEPAGLMMSPAARDPHRDAAVRRTPLRDSRQLFPPRAQPGPDADADLPDARVRPRR